MNVRGLLWTALLLGAVGGTAAPAAADGHTLMRFPTLHGDAIVFEAHGNLWQVPRSGGAASRLTADPGYDLMPRFSPDGNWIAFTAQLSGQPGCLRDPGRRRRGEAADLPFRRGREGDDALGARQHGGDLDAGLAERRLPVAAHGLELLVRTAVRGPGRRRLADAVAARPRRPDELQPGRQIDRLQPHLPQFPHLEALSRRPGAGRRHLQFRHQEALPRHRLEGHRHRADVGRPQDLFPFGPRRTPPREHLGLRPRQQAVQRSHPFHRLRHRFSEPRRHAASSFSRAARSGCSTCPPSSCTSST